MKSKVLKLIAFIVIDVIVITVLQYAVNSVINTYLKDKGWKIIFIALLSTLFLLLLTLEINIIWQKVRKTRMQGNIRNEINDIQLSVLQDFLELQMKNHYGNGWMCEVEQVVNSKISLNDTRANTYRSLYDKIQRNGIETVDKKDMDITLVSALLMYDFIHICSVGTAFRAQVGRIRTDKNEYISHNSDLNDKISNNIMELSSLKNLKLFLEYLRNAGWNNSGSEAFIHEYEKRVDLAIQLFYKSVMEEEKPSLDMNCDINMYLKRIIQDQEEHSANYVPLSYKRVDDSLNRYSLEDLYHCLGRGLVLFADAGYGKSWSLIELAANYSRKYIQNPESNALPVLLKMGQVVTSSNKVIKEYISETFCPEPDADNGILQFMKNRKIILFVDGMDEAQTAIKDNVKAELKDIYENYPNITIVGGTREIDRFRFPSELPQFSICDLSDEQIEGFINKLIYEEYRKKAKEALISDDNSFLKNMRTPFYLTCYAEFINYGETDPQSTTDIVARCVDKMIDREIRIKGFSASLDLINTFLCKFCELLGDRNFISENEAIKVLKESVYIDSAFQIDIVRIKNKMIELQILRSCERNRHYYIGFANEQYRTIYAPNSNDDTLLDF